MKGIVLDSAIKAIARYLVKLEALVVAQYNGSISLSTEITELNNTYNFVPQSQLKDFISDVSLMFTFEKNRQLQSISSVAFAEFKLDQLTGKTGLNKLKNELNSEIQSLFSA